MQNLITRLGIEHRVSKENLSRYVLQCSLAAAFVLVLLMILDAVTQTVLIAAFGASTFIAFAVPRSPHSGPRHMIGGYVVGMLAGGALGAINTALQVSSPSTEHESMIVFGALATGLAMFLMVVTKTEHPPAASLALGLVLNEWDFLTLAVILSGIVALSVVKRLVLPLLMDLL